MASSATLSNEALYEIFEGTLSSDKLVRERAEQTLNDLSLQCHDLVLHLIRFCCEPLSSPTTLDHAADGGHEFLRHPQPSLLQKHRNMQLAAAIRVHNVLGRSDWNRNAYFTEELKALVREQLIPIQCQPHLSEHVRRQLLVTTNALIQYEFPDRWPGLISQLEGLLGEWSTALQAGVDAEALPTQGFCLVVQLKAGLGILAGCCRVYEDPLKVEAAAVDDFAASLVPSLVGLAEMLEALWSREVRQQSIVDHAALQGSGVLEPSPLQAELSHCLRLILKCFWSLCQPRWPKCLCESALFHRLWQTCFKRPTEVAYMHYLPWCRRQLFRQQQQQESLQRGSNGEGMTTSYERPGDQFETFQQTSLWRMLKWVGNFSHKLLQDFMVPKSCEKRARAVATLFCETYMTDVVQAALYLARWHTLTPTAEECPSQPPIVWLVSSKAYIMALETLSMAVSHRRLYETILHPAAEELMTVLLFPRLAFSDEDSELWTSNPEEYVRKQTSPTGDIYSPKVVAVSTLLELVTSRKKHIDAELLPKFANFLMNQLLVYAPRGLQALGEAESGPEDWEAARRVDAALFCIYHFKKALFGMQLGHEHLENVLSTFVVPAMQSRLGFLRARAVLVLSVFAPSIEWSSPGAYQAALRVALPLLRDTETPVQIQACACFSRLTCHPHARDVVTPCIAELIQHYFQIMRLMDSESVVRTLRKTISFYRDSLSQWGLQLADMIVNHFSHVGQTFSNKYNVLESGGAGGNAEAGESRAMSGYLEDEGLADTLMAADELLETLITLVKVLPSSPSPREGTMGGGNTAGSSLLSPTETEMGDNLFVQMQQCVAPMLFFILSHQSGSAFGFMDSALNLLTTLLRRSPCVASVTWRLLPCLHHMVCTTGTTDYFAEMLAPIDNFVSVSPQLFLTAPMSVLCGGEAHVPCFAGGSSPSGSAEGAVQNVGGCTPAQLLQEMCRTVLCGPNSHNREVSAVPKLYDSLLQNYWLLVFSSSPSTWLFSTPYNWVEAMALGEPTASLFAECVVKPITQQVFYVFSNRPKLNSTLRVLFSNVILSCILADANTTLSVLTSSETAYSFFEQYVYLVVEPSVVGNAAALPLKDVNKRRKDKQTSITAGACAGLLRSYDRALFILAFSRAMGFLAAYQAHCEQQQQQAEGHLEGYAALDAALRAVLTSGLLEQFARQDFEASTREMAFHVKRLKKGIAKMQKGAAAAAKLPLSAGLDVAMATVARGVTFLESQHSSLGKKSVVHNDEDGWIDDDDGSSDGESVTTSSEGMGGEESDDMFDDDNDDGLEEDFGEANNHDSDVLHSLCAQAQQARGETHDGPTVGGTDSTPMDRFVGGLGEDDDDEFDNLLDEDEFESAVDGVNPWGVLMDGLVAHDEYFHQTTRQNLWGLIAQHKENRKLTEVKEAVDLLFLLRTQSAELLQE